MAQWLRAHTVLPYLGFNSQHPHGGSQLSVTPVPGGLIPSHRHTYKHNTNTHKIKRKKSKEEMENPHIF